MRPETTDLTADNLCDDADAEVPAPYEEHHDLAEGDAFRSKLNDHVFRQRVLLGHAPLSD